MIEIDKEWPQESLESFDRCPFCKSKAKEIVYENVQDWSFYVAPGRWNYWQCKKCQTLYLNPHPNSQSIGKAYGNYYTHKSVNSFLQNFKERIKNECWSHWLSVDIKPRFRIPQLFNRLINKLKSRIAQPFGLIELIKLPKGKLLDVGCGNGNMLNLAKSLGWQVHGLEIDPFAVEQARKRNLEIIEGTYERLSEFKKTFDCIICSHVLEHVHHPDEMLRLLKNALKIKGTLIISLPNADSILKQDFGENWRGLEAPRHLSIPTWKFLKIKLEKMGFLVSVENSNFFATAAESSRIKRRSKKINRFDREVMNKYNSRKEILNNHFADFIQFICFKVGK